MLALATVNTFKDQIINTDAMTLFRSMPSESVNCIVTSPPYFGLRDYGVAGQIGLEKTPAEYVATMVQLFREARRVLKSDGTFWLNLGDSYARTAGDDSLKAVDTGLSTGRRGKSKELYTTGNNRPAEGFKPKDLYMIPARVAIALQDDGWYLRSEIVWHKPNAMPESVKDRPAKAHEMVYLLTKSPSYWYDWEAIQEPIAESTGPRMLRGVSDHHKNIDGAPGQIPHSMNKPRTNIRKQDMVGKATYTGFNDRWDAQEEIPTHRNKRDVWTVPTKPFSEAHFATFPTDLIEPMILAGCPKGGIVYDPFMGSGTTALVARKLNRHFIGSELNPEYIEIAKRRLYTPMDLWLQEAS